jgi:hypothetical protein
VLQHRQHHGCRAGLHGGSVPHGRCTSILTGTADEIRADKKPSIPVPTASGEAAGPNNEAGSAKNHFCETEKPAAAVLKSDAAPASARQARKCDSLPGRAEGEVRRSTWNHHALSREASVSASGEIVLSRPDMLRVSRTRRPLQYGRDGVLSAQR